jgi:BrnA antitoxin of type II toxin-antitoxin system
MRAEYDFSKAKRRALLPTKGKTRITIYIDDAVLDEFRSRAEKAGGGYQTMMNDALKAYLADTDDRPLTESVLRRVIREELPASARLTKRSSGRSKTRAAER